MWIMDWFTYLSKMKLCSQHFESQSHYFKLYYAAQKGYGHPNFQANSDEWQRFELQYLLLDLLAL